MVLRRNRVARMTDADELCRLTRLDDPDIAQLAMDRLADLLGTHEIDRASLRPDDLHWLGLASRLRLQDARNWSEAIAVIRTMDVFEATGRWYPLLTQLMTGEVAIACPGCGQRLILRRTREHLGLVIIDGVVHDIPPAESQSLASAERDFHRAVQAERPDLARVLLQLFSPMVCPGCGTRSQLTLEP